MNMQINNETGDGVEFNKKGDELEVIIAGQCVVISKDDAQRLARFISYNFGVNHG